MTPRRFVVTGGMGFIGSHVVTAIARHGYDVIVVDEKHTVGRYCHDIHYEFIEKDVFLDRIRDKSFMDGVAVVFHLGACSDTLEQNGDYLLKNNTEYSKHIAASCAKFNVRLLYASSAATYGDGSRGYSDTQRQLSPLNLYGRSKYVFDEWLLESDHKPPQYAGFKFFNVYGPHEEHKGQQASVPYRKYGEVISRGYIELFRSYRAEYPDGCQKRDFVWIDDVVSVLFYFLDHHELSGIFNVGTGRARTFLDCARALFSALDREPDIRFIDMPTSLKDQYQYYTEADLSTLRSVGYSAPFADIEEGILSYVRYLRQSAHNR